MSDIAQIRVRLLADLADLDKMRSEVTRTMRQVNSDTKREMTEAKHSIALFGDEIGVRIPRELRGVIAQMPGVATAINAAFSAIAVVAFAQIVFEAGKKVEEFATKNEEAAKKNAEAWTKVQTSIASQNDELESTKIKLENAIAKLEHKPENKLKEAIAEARVEADKLGDKLDSVVKQIQDAVKGEQSGTLAKLFLHQTGATQTAKVMEDLQVKLADIDNGRVQGDPTALRNQAVQTAISSLQPIAQSSGDTFHRLQANGTPTEHSSSRVEYEASSEALKALRGMSSVIENTVETGQLKQHLDQLTDAAAKSAEALQEQLKQAEVWSKYQQAGGRISVLGRQERQQYRAETTEDTKFQIGNPFGMLGEKSLFGSSDVVAEQHAGAVKQIAIDQAKLNEALVASSTKYAVATGAISEHSAAVLMAAAHQQAYTAELDALNTELAKLQSTVTLTADDAQKNADAQAKLRQQIVQVQAQADQQHLDDLRATESAFDQVFDHIRQGAQGIDAKIAAIMEHTIDGLNDQFVGAMFGDRTNFSRVFEQQGRSMAKVGLQWLEGSLLGKKGSGKITDLHLSATNGALNVHVAGSSLTGGSGSSGSDQNSGPHSSLFRSMFPGLSNMADSIKNSPVGQWLSENGKKYMPRAMDMAGGLMSMLQGPEHSKGEGSGVTNALAHANHKQNSLSRFLMGFGNITKGAGSMMFAGAGGMQGLNDDDAAGQLFGGRLFGQGGLFDGDDIPGFASGGDTYGGLTMVGEDGPELADLPGGTHITPNRDISSFGGGPTYNIDARNTDPALTRQNVAQAIAASNAHAVNQAQSRIIDRQRRTPR